MMPLVPTSSATQDDGARFQEAGVIEISQREQYRLQGPITNKIHTPLTRQFVNETGRQSKKNDRGDPTLVAVS